jgi:predicted PurR-regulated permease PerM
MNKDIRLILLFTFAYFIVSVILGSIVHSSESIRSRVVIALIYGILFVPFYKFFKKKYEKDKENKDKNNNRKL